MLSFSNTYTEVQRRADIIWKFQRYDLIQQYQKRVFLPPPLSLPLNVYHLLRHMYFYIKSESTQGIPTAQDKAKFTLVQKYQLGLLLNA